MTGTAAKGCRAMELQASRLRLAGHVESFAGATDGVVTFDASALPPLAYAPLDVAGSSLDLGLRIEDRRDPDARGEQACSRTSLGAWTAAHRSARKPARRIAACSSRCVPCSDQDPAAPAIVPVADMTPR